MSMTTKSIEVRVAALERSRRVSWLLTGVLAVAAVALGADKASELTVRSLTVTDAAGKKRVQLDTHPATGAARFSMYDSAGKCRIAMDVGKGDLADEAGTIFIVREDQKPAVSLGETNEKSGKVLVNSSSGEVAASLPSIFPWLDKPGAPGLAATKAAPPVARRAAPSSRRAAPAVDVPNVSLVLTDLTSTPSRDGQYMAIEGRVRNVSDAALPFVRVEITYENAAGRLVTTSTAYCVPAEVAPGGVATFSSFDPAQAAMDHVKLSFQVRSGGAVPWLDRSGKNAHQ
jgi:hypothetical protein